MPSFEDIMNVNTKQLKTAIADWTSLIKKLEKLEHSAKSMEQKSKKADWAGHNAGVTNAFVAKTSTEFSDAITQATSTRNVLRTAYVEVSEAKETLNSIIAEAKKKGCHVSVKGKVKRLGGHPLTASPPDGNSTVVDLQARINRCTERVTKSDQSTSSALRALSRDSYNFSKKEYESIDDRRLRKETNEAVDLAKKKDEMTTTELARFASILKKNGSNAEFSEGFARGLGPKGALEFWMAMGTPLNQPPGKEQMKHLANIQKYLSVTLSEASKSDSPEMKEWKKGIIDLGMKKIESEDAPPRRGFQVMNHLMQDGEYDTEFLKNYGNALVEAEAEAKNRSPLDPWTEGASLPYVFDYAIPETSSSRDPASGFMTALSNNPTAATDFFNMPSSQESHEGAPITNLEYFMKERDYPDEISSGDGRRQAHVSTAEALLAAGSGIKAGDDEAVANMHTPEQTAVFKEIIRINSEGNEFQPEARDSMAKLLVNHGVSVHETVSDNSGNRSPLKVEHVISAMKEVSKDQNSHGLLNVGMQQVLLESFKEKDPGHPEDQLTSAGNTVGALERAKYLAITEQGASSASEAGWKKNYIYHGVGSLLNLLPGGDLLQRGSDVFSLWLLDQDNESIENDIEEGNKETRSVRERQLAQLAEAWFQENKDWAESRDGYSEERGVYGVIGTAADVGNNRAKAHGGGQ